MELTLSKSIIVCVVLCRCMVPIRAPGEESKALKKANAEYAKQQQAHLSPGHDKEPDNNGRAHLPTAHRPLYGGMVVEWEDDAAFAKRTRGHSIQNTNDYHNQLRKLKLLFEEDIKKRQQKMEWRQFKYKVTRS
ncbi:hypothetical protein DdX_17470 [Ditylenchus destructor]|uniref:Uncharacterized protein n=1 Tax=Ditylenchus destructor TaxID=166010 RepID=A0AAD4QTE9_9BILA|nr:hypothetical protein DdX_17470 [Ditylenchus destructor]